MRKTVNIPPLCGPCFRPDNRLRVHEGHMELRIGKKRAEEDIGEQKPVGGLGDAPFQVSDLPALGRLMMHGTATIAAVWYIALYLFHTEKRDKTHQARGGDANA
ncbi:hypothetical protein B0H16DRAFT_1450146 [Mycena metata]|uniref:Uncharacterized protein n=1 Tax=Mycena metata TaxID=1033252 RepID=A0AAD7K0C7_9AGAR|nr:hypothetical protein B0H16DRAFT_1450146 [Mycena metata]